jgi:hypothetical protein
MNLFDYTSVINKFKYYLLRYFLINIKMFTICQ